MKTVGPREPRLRGFTLIELLVVIAIIAILMAILFPVFATARRDAQRTACSSNMGQIALAIRMYSDDYDGKFPRVGIMVSQGVWVCTNYLAPQYYQQALNPYIKMGRGALSHDDVWWDPCDPSKNALAMWGSFVTNGYITCNDTCETEIANPSQMIYSALRAPMPEWAIWNGVTMPTTTPPASDPFWSSEYFDMGIDPYDQSDPTSPCYYTTGKICPPLSLFPNDPTAQDWQPGLDTQRYGGLEPYAFMDGHVKCMHFASTYTSLNNNMWNLK
ncbi:MAG: type II secretion system protein [Capsulimonadaceae bacterium]